jgi:hypothetical protein
VADEPPEEALAGGQGGVEVMPSLLVFRYRKSPLLSG